MFTGIIEEIGTITRFRRRGDRYDLEIEAGKITEDLRVDDSVNINGVCLTVVETTSGGFRVQVVPQTLRLSALEDYRVGDRVNLERAMAAGGRFGGHFVQGHVDGCADIKRIQRENDHATLSLTLSSDLTRFCIDQGSVAVDGVSLTIAGLRAGEMEIAIIPHTLKQTTLHARQRGDRVNIEVDMLSKYIQKHLQSMQSDRNMTIDWIQEQGFE